MTKRFTMEYEGRPGSKRDDEAVEIIDANCGVIVSAGTFIGGEKPIRDVQFEVDDPHADTVIGALKEAGFDPRPY